jgi:hypothetical protein
VQVLYEYHQKGVIAFPKHLPAIIKDMNGLAIWMAFSNFLNRMKLDDIITEKTHHKKFAV